MKSLSSGCSSGDVDDDKERNQSWKLEGDGLYIVCLDYV
jgi:hypothetical protein